MDTENKDILGNMKPEPGLEQEPFEYNTPSAPRKKFNLLEEIRSYLMIFIIAFVIAFVLNHFFIINCKVPTGSMLDTIQLKDQIIGNRLAYVFSEPQRGDVVIFKYPDDTTGKTIYIKRVIGLPGETVEIIDGKVYINESETPLDEPYLNETNQAYKGNWGPYVVPEGCYFMLGDNRVNSKDSRYWNNTYVSKEKILGKALFIYFPFSDAKWLATDIDY